MQVTQGYVQKATAPLGDYTSMGVTLHAKYCINWHYLFALKM